MEKRVFHSFQFTKVIILLFSAIMYNFKQGRFKKTGTIENNDGCYEVQRALTYA